MNDVLYLAWRYLVFNRIKTLILLFSVTLILFLPTALKVVVDQSATALMQRAEASPILIGAKGSPLELVLNSLYFESEVPETIAYAELERVSDYQLGHAVPVYARFRAGGHPIVGTTLDYFDARQLEVADGRAFAALGECVLGTTAARKLGVGVGGVVISSPETVFDLAGVYPLKMQVVGVLAPTQSPDDEAVFADLKTTWIIEGLAHGHADLGRPEAASAVLRKDGQTIVANASVQQYQEVTAANASSFHFHGDWMEFPITGVLVFPETDKAATLLRGKYVGPDERQQLLVPQGVMAELMQTIFTIRRYLIIAIVVLGFSTLATLVLVFLLSLKLRQREIWTLHRIGGSRARVVGILTAEVLLVLGLSAVLALGMTVLTANFGALLFERIFIH